jgi:hypothetical protein
MSVEIPLPKDLEFETYNYTGLSPSSSESTTAEALTPSLNPPSLLPIKEGCCQQSPIVSSPQTKGPKGEMKLHLWDILQWKILHCDWRERSYWMQYQAPCGCCEDCCLLGCDAM